jgi:hypothetical protein
LIGSSPKKVNVPSPQQKMGSVTFKANKSGADISVKDSNGKDFYYKTPSFGNRLPIGSYTAYAEKTGYIKSPVKTFNVYDSHTTEVIFDLKKYRWIKQTEFFAYNFLDFNYGFGIPRTYEPISSSFIGLDYTYLETHLGLHTSAMYGLDYNEIGLHAGPILRLTDDSSAVDFQIYTGVGAVKSPYSLSGESWKLSGDVGLRMNFDDDHDWSWLSLSAGCMFAENMLVPKIGTSLLFPANIGYLTESSEYDFAAHFLDVICGFDMSEENADVLVGASYAWCRTHLGVYTTCMIGTMYDSFSFSAGPVIRLTSDYSFCDLQIYGGPGMMNGYMMADFGIRFGWQSDAFSLWDFSIGCQYYNATFVPTFGVGIAIPLVVAGGLLIGLAGV